MAQDFPLQRHMQGIHRKSAPARRKYYTKRQIVCIADKAAEINPALRLESQAKIAARRSRGTCLMP
jgi:hypothetical protein